MLDDAHRDERQGRTNAYTWLMKHISQSDHCLLSVVRCGLDANDYLALSPDERSRFYFRLATGFEMPDNYSDEGWEAMRRARDEEGLSPADAFRRAFGREPQQPVVQ